MATWAMLKTEKMNNLGRQSAFGSYKRHADNAEKPVPRDGKARRVAELSQEVVVPSNHVVVTRLEAGKASGLSRDIGVVGKGGRVAFRACGGDGRRVRQGDLRSNQAYVAELLTSEPVR